jgi:methylisocitrate lyase
MFLSRCKEFRKLLESSCVMLPGAFNGMTGRLIAESGYSGCYISGAALTADYGVPDIGLLTLPEFTHKIKQVAIASGLPIICDADTGFGEGEAMARTVYEYYLNGASGLHIEDQVFPKRCGHLDGKTLVSAEDMSNKIRIAHQASLEVSQGEFIICARTDARGVDGIEETIRRSRLYIDAGADMIFPEGLCSKEEFALVAKELRESHSKVMLLANMTEFGKTPYITLEEFKSMGYNCVIYPVSPFRIANKAISDFLVDLKKNGTQEGTLAHMQTRKELYNTLGYTPGKEWYFPQDTSKKIK